MGFEIDPESIDPGTFPKLKRYRHELDGMVPIPNEAFLDAGPGDDWTDLADPLSHHPRDLWIRPGPMLSKETSLGTGTSFRDQPCRQPGVHTDSIRIEEPAIGGDRHRDRLGNDSMDHGCDLEALSMGCPGTDSLLSVGLPCQRAATVDHLEQLVSMGRILPSPAGGSNSFPPG